LRRRHFLAASSASLALPSLVRAASATTLKFVPQIDLAFLDPHWTTANVTRGHGYMVFDTLYGQDGTYTPQPQMIEGHVIENDGKFWKLTLREGLLWHDGQTVLARDCVASIRRWAKRDRRIVRTRRPNHPVPPEQTVSAATQRAEQTDHAITRHDAGTAG
jgi:peptide/nickel transport system substrate-binding protein